MRVSVEYFPSRDAPVTGKLEVPERGKRAPHFDRRLVRPVHIALPAREDMTALIRGSRRLQSRRMGAWPQVFDGREQGKRFLPVPT